MRDDDHKTSENQPAGVKRREALKVLAAATLPVLGASGTASAQPVAPEAPQATPAAGGLPNYRGPRGDAWDPNLLNPSKNWPRLLTGVEMDTLAALCDVIIPADSKSPSASAVGAHHYINEHVSAPGESYARDLVRVRGGVSWLNLESDKRFGKKFSRLTLAQKTAICDDICYLPKAKEEFHAAARFFSLVRNLTATAFYTTDPGMKDIGFVGNQAAMKWELPPKAVLKALGLD